MNPDETSVTTHSIDHRKGGLEQQISQLRTATVAVRQAIENVEEKIAGVLGEFRTLANIWEFEDRFLSDHEAFTWRHEGQSAKARAYWIFSLCATLLAVIFGAYFSYYSLNAQSGTTLLLVATATAAVLGAIASGILWSSIGAHPDKPSSERTVTIWVWATGFVLIVAIGVFGWSRFVRHSLSETGAATLIVFLELSAILLAGSFACGYGIFSWSKKLDDKFRLLKAERNNLEGEMAEKTVMLQELQYRKDRSESRLAPADDREEVTK